MLIGMGIGGIGIAASPGGARASFDPASVAGLQVWLKADAGITQSSGTVSAWADQSGNSNSFAQSNGGYQPTYTAAGQNGLPVVTWGGTNKYLLSTGNITLSNFTFFAILSRPVWSNSQYRGIWGHNSSPTQKAFGVDFTNKFWGFGNSSAVAPSVLGPIGTLTNASFHLLSAGLGPANSFLRKNKTSIATTASNAATTSITAQMIIGSWNYPVVTDHWDGAMGEMLIYNSVLTGTDLTNVENYLQAKWGTP